MDPIKDSFNKVKQDIDSLKNEIDNLRIGLSESKEALLEMCELIKKIDQKIKENASTDRQIIPTTSTHPSTHRQSLEPLKHQNIGISTGNQGVPTDRQTDRQTDKYSQITPKIQENMDKNSIDNAVEILDSLDNIKKEIRLKFKRLTDQEMLIFSTLYQLDEEQGFSDYKSISERLKLTESSIRDYIGRLIKKGIPVEKNRINNKNIQLKISENLKKIVSLPTILQLRDL